MVEKRDENNNAYYDKGSCEAIKLTRAASRKIEERRKLTLNSNRLLIVLVGLPGRGKSFIARKLQSYLNWLCIPCKTFNVGKYRREAKASYDDKDPSDEASGGCKADFFDSTNEAATKLREDVAKLALNDALSWLDSIRDDEYVSFRRNDERGITAIFDATNSTRKRRDLILKTCANFEKRNGKRIGIVFIETICDDEEILEENMNFKVAHSPDYHGIPYEEASRDIRERVRKYEEKYETITDDSLSYIKVFNLSSKVLANLIYGRISKVVVPALMAWHIGHRPIYICRPGKVDTNEFEGKRLQRCGRLDATGIRFRDALCKFMREEGEAFISERGKEVKTTGTSLFGGRSSFLDMFETDHIHPGKIMCSTMPRSFETVMWNDSALKVDVLSNLNPLDKGDFTGMELSDIKIKDPQWYSKLEHDAYNTRFPGGECYHDLITRLESCVIDMEQQVIPVLVVSHVSVIQVLLSYFRNTPVQKSSSIKVPMHTIIKLVPSIGGGWTEYQFPLLDEQSMSQSSPQSSIIDSSPQEPMPPIWTDAHLDKIFGQTC